MPCYYHPDREPIASCVQCGRLVCSECAVVEGTRTFCSHCFASQQSGMTQSQRRRQRKSPLVAVLLSIVPGLGQIYNEQLFKGLLIMVVFFVVVLTFVGGGLTWWSHVLFGDARLIGNMPYFFTPQHVLWNRSPYPHLALFLLIPLIYCYAIFDAAVSASRINRGEIALYTPRTRHIHRSSTTPSDDQLRREANATMAASGQTSNQAGEQHVTSGRPHSPHHHGKHANTGSLGWALIVVGLLLCGIATDIYWLRLEHIWPVVPLLFGLRLLWDYRRYQEQSQLLLGTVFSVGGAYFLLRQIDPIDDFLNAVMDHWLLCLAMCLVVLGVYLVFMNWKEQRRNKKN
ncbi:MAG: hypothetical protein ABIH23_29220 [bacterium]